MSRDTHIERLKSDKLFLQSLPANSSHVDSVSPLVSYDPPDQWEIVFNIPGIINVQGDLAYRFIVKMLLGPKYPFEAGPEFTISPTLFHPNVWASGAMCLGVQYSPSFLTKDYVEGVARTIGFTDDRCNLGSIARGNVAPFHEIKQWWQQWISAQKRVGKIPVKDVYLMDKKPDEVSIRRQPTPGGTPAANPGVQIRRRGAEGLSSQPAPPLITIRKKPS